MLRFSSSSRRVGGAWGWFSAAVFLGLRIWRIIQERLELEFNLDLIRLRQWVRVPRSRRPMARPVEVDTPSRWPAQPEIEKIDEPRDSGDHSDSRIICRCILKLVEEKPWHAE